MSITNMQVVKYWFGKDWLLIMQCWEGIQYNHITQLSHDSLRRMLHFIVSNCKVEISKGGGLPPPHLGISKIESNVVAKFSLLAAEYIPPPHVNEQ